MAWSNVKGFNFRATLGFVTDNAANPYEVAELSAAYSATRNTINGDVVGYGWTGTLASASDRVNTVDRRLAGINYSNNSSGEKLWRLDLPSAGTYTIRLALGSANGAGTIFARIYDGATPTFTIASNVSTLADQFIDATSVIRTSDTDWVTNNASQNFTFSSSYLQLGIGDPSTISGGSSWLAHLDIVQVSAGVAARNLMTLGLG